MTTITTPFTPKMIELVGSIINNEDLESVSLKINQGIISVSGDDEDMFVFGEMLVMLKDCDNQLINRLSRYSQKCLTDRLDPNFASAVQEAVQLLKALLR